MISFDTSFIPKKKGVYLVGGSLRDALLGRKPLDYDIVVKENPLAYAGEIATHQNGRLVFMGKPGQQLIRVVFKNTLCDISAMKGGSIEEDLIHRDFTINALAYETATEKLIDISGGLDDFKKRCIRMVSASIFKEDPLRLLRAYRLAASLDFRLDPSTDSCIKRDAHLIHHTAGERIRDEVFKILSIPDSFTFINQMKASGLLFELLPEIGALRGCCRNRHHAYDGLEHTLRAFCALEILLKNVGSQLPEYAAPLNHWLGHRKKILLKWAVLLHDIGKPLCEARDGSGNIHFWGHEKTGSILAGEIGKRLKFSNHEIHYIVFMVRNHLRPLSLFIARQNQTLTNRGIARFFMTCEENALDVLLHAVADFQAKKEAFEDGGKNKFIHFIKELIHQYFTRYLPLRSDAPIISGRDLIAVLHLKPSPMFKTILSRVAEARLAGHILTRDDALTLARDIAGGKKSG
jgi:tRNA nucleotidyltransferase/poly(A) polymerase